MSARIPSFRLRRPDRAFTLSEVLMATAIAAIFLTGMITAFMQILKTTNRTQAVTTAIDNGRVALDALATQIKQANYTVAGGRFIGLDNPTPLLTARGLRYGDGIDNDGDGKIDEEVVNGLDDDGDWTPACARHALIAPGIYERPETMGKPDLGDDKVDLDCLFENDTLGFQILPLPDQPTPQDKEVTFALGSYQGRDHVLLQTTRQPATQQATAVTEVAPLAENILSFAVLYWNENATPPYWVVAWDSAGAVTQTGPKLPLPSSVYLQLQVYADDRPIETYRPGDPVKVEIVSTVVNIEQIIHDPRYPRP